MEKKLLQELEQLREKQKHYQHYFESLFQKIIGKIPQRNQPIESLAEKAVKHLQNIIYLMPGNIFWKNRKGISLGCNRGLLQSLGLASLQDYIGKTYEELLDKKVISKIRRVNEKVMKGNRIITLEENGILPDGSKAIFLTKKRPLHDQEGKVIGLLGISMDITKRKREELELEKTKKRLKLLEKSQRDYFQKLSQRLLGLNNGKSCSIEKCAEEIILYFKNILRVMPGNVYWKDREGRYLGCNINLLKIHGYQEEDIIGKTYEDIFKPKVAEHLRNQDMKIMASGQSFSLEEEGYDINKKPATYLSAEKATKKAKEEAEAANAVKGQFIENMQHDLRTPTAGIYGMMKIYADREKDPEKKKMFSIMSESAKELLRLLDGVLRFTHIESRNLPILEKKFHIRKVIDQLIALEKPAAVEKGLRLTTRVDKNVPNIVKGDDTRLHDILINLLSNAIKFTQRGSVSIQVKQKKDKKVKNKVLIKFIITDTGMGISKAQQVRVYEKFVKLDPSNRCGTYRGSGLGLTVVKQFVDDLGGEIDLISQVGKGSKFTIVLPFALSMQGDPDEEDFEDKIFFK